ncbi:hypothetical protein BJX64DRAFT_56001 [Aspergillus heterothallicus]
MQSCQPPDRWNALLVDQRGNLSNTPLLDELRLIHEAVFSLYRLPRSEITDIHELSSSDCSSEPCSETSAKGYRPPPKECIPFGYHIAPQPLTARLGIPSHFHLVFRMILSGMVSCYWFIAHKI